MSGQGSGSGGQRRSDRLAKGKAVAYVPESSPDTDDEYDAMEDVRTRVDSAMPGTCRRSLMPRLLVLLLVRPDLLLGLVLPSAVGLGLLVHLVVPPRGRQVLLLRD
jgi:hypothetical protein